MEKIERNKITISGIVQGVGFRPFIYNAAMKYGICGFIKNNSDGVYIEAEGTKLNLKKFKEVIKNEPPKISYIDSFIWEEIQNKFDSEFKILKSDKVDRHSVFVSPDIGICDNCENELNNEKNLRSKYPFINCTNCGPRFTITKKVPYDRKNTTMKNFKMCPKCTSEYNNPKDRRFHAQPISCYNCGPINFVLDSKGDEIKTNDPIEYVAQEIKKGKIVGIKGLGGFHLVCDGKNDNLVRVLRKRKKRDKKPFAIMVKNIEVAKEHCTMNSKEVELLESQKKPVVLLAKKQDSSLPMDISLDNNKIGVMLPYTPLHLLIFHEGLDILVMTSGNISGQPIFHENMKAVDGLKDVADLYLGNDRDIHIRTDDSVTSILNGEEYIIRRSRGYVPMPVKISNKFDKNENTVVLACGSELKNTFAITKKNYVFISHHIGDLENYETLISFEKGIEHFKDILMVKPNIIACDMHPEYLSTKYALEQNTKVVKIQHHHAHIASCMAENSITDDVIGIAFDGTGYGDDGAIWGGEIFTGNLQKFSRVGHLKYVNLPGGEKAIEEPWRIAFGNLIELYGEKLSDMNFEFLKGINLETKNIVKFQIDNNINSPKTSSVGRLFDAVSALLNICTKIDYEGQAAILFENHVIDDLNEKYPIDNFIDKEEHTYIINTIKFFEYIVNDLINGVQKNIIATKFHITLANIVVKICILIRDSKGINNVALSGGVFQNFTLIKLVINQLESKKFKVYRHSKVPTNDGGISLGQAAIALCRFNNEPT